MEFHRVLTQGINYPYNEPGRYRNHAVTVGPYRPPATGEEVRGVMAEFVHWFNTGTPTLWDPVIRSIVAHFYLVSPFLLGDTHLGTAMGALLGQWRVSCSTSQA